MGIFKPDAPTPPNPLQTASAATGTNVSTAVANAYLNNTNQNTPTGSLSYDTTGSHTWTDPTTNQTYTIPTFTATQSLTPQGQAIQNQNLATQLNMAGMANAQSQKIAALLGNNMDFSGAPAAGSSAGLKGVGQAATSFDQGGPIQTSIGTPGDITKTYGTDFSADRQRVEDSLMARMNPQLQIEQQRLQQQLADQGIRYGSQAYSDAMLNNARQADDARWGAIQNAGQEQQRMVQEESQRAAFQNQAQQQGYEQQLGMGTFANTAQGQQFQQNAALAAFQNAGLAQQTQQQQGIFNADQAARNSWMQEQYAQRNQPINEITSLLSGSQVQQPNFVNTPGSQIPTTDVAGIMQQNFQNQMGIYSQQNNNFNQLMGGVLGAGGKLGGAAITASDRNVKENITQLGTVFSTNEADDREKLPIYQYSYKDDPTSTRHIGPMAQDVEKQDKRAVTTIGGVKHIYPHRVMGNILRAA